jgi:integrase/recombinase XerD
MIRTPVREKAKQFSKLLKKEQPDYNYLREVFRHIRKEMNIEVDPGRPPQKLPYVPTEEEIEKFYQGVWKSRNMNYVVIVKTFLYTGVRVSELIKIKLSDIDLDNCQIRVISGKGKKDRIVPFPKIFMEVLAVHMDSAKQKKATYLFESVRKKPYSDRGIRKIMQKYTEEAGIEHTISPHKLRHFLFTWLKRKGVDDALIQPYSGHQQRSSLEVYSKLSLSDCQKEYENQIKNFPI